MILQAYDFLHLHDKYGCVLQCGGSDQWSNIISGVDLIKRTRGEEVVGLTTPLMTLASGKKMGKTEDGAVWLNEEMLSPYQYYQFWRNVPDADVFKFMRLYTDLSLEDISKHEQSSDINDAKKLLAFEATRLCHGEQHATDASATAKAAFEEGNMDSIETVSLPISVLEQGIPIADLFKMCGLSGSKGEAKRLIQGGGAKMNQQKVTDEEMVVTQAHLNQGVIVLSSGKKRFIRVEFN
jgi:tyrosyl-tRNA synthetase